MGKGNAGRKNDGVKPLGAQLVQSVERAVDILSCFSIDKPELALGEISAKTGLPKSTVSRLILTLKSKEFIEQDLFTQKYRIGFRIYTLGNIYATEMDLRKAAYPLMVDLNEKTSETVNLNIIDKGERVCIEKIESPHSLRNFVKIGERNSLCFGASGKVMLSFLPAREALAIIDEHKLGDEKKRALLGEIEEVRRQGYCISVTDRVEGAMGISAPIFDQHGKLTAGLTVSGPVNRLFPRKEALAEKLVSSARLLSAKMGSHEI